MYDRTRELLTKHKADVEKVAQLLLEKEVINRYVVLQLRRLYGSTNEHTERT